MGGTKIAAAPFKNGLLMADELIKEATPQSNSHDILETMSNMVNKISYEGVTILIIDKLSHRLISLSRSGFIIEKGETVWSGQMSRLSNSIARKYLSV